jgi:hypothetical protein
VYLVDQPGRGDAGQTTKPASIPATPDDQTWFTQFRIGLHPDFNEGVQFPKDEQSLDRFFRMMAPNTGNVDEATTVGAMSAVFDRSGEGIAAARVFVFWRLHSKRRNGCLFAELLAQRTCHGTAMGGCCKRSRRRCNHCSFARNRYQRQHPLHYVRFAIH